MKHQKEWHTCDMCGAEIEKPKIQYDRIFHYLRTVNLKRPICFKEIFAEIEMKNGYTVLFMTFIVFHKWEIGRIDYKII